MKPRNHLLTITLILILPSIILSPFASSTIVNEDNYTQNPTDRIGYGRFTEMGGEGNILFGRITRFRQQHLIFTFNLVIELGQSFEDHGYVIVNGDIYAHPDFTTVKIPIFFGRWKWDPFNSDLLLLNGFGFGVKIT
jgi:hypothetical protein